MPNPLNRAPMPSTPESNQPIPWHTFSDILKRLHQEGIYIHSHQLAAFFVYHGLPVDLHYVPDHLQQRAASINTHYQGDLAKLETMANPTELFPFE